MKRLLLCAGLLAAFDGKCAAEVEWMTDVPAAIEKAKAENKIVLLDFTGSDWCGWCMKLKSEVFDQPDFGAFAKADLVMVEVDFPRHKFIAPSQMEANEKLATKYEVKGYPTIILLNGAGEKVGQSGYIEGGSAKYIADLQQRVPSMKPWSQAVAQDNREILHSQSSVAFVPIAPATPNRYGQLTLKGISGTGNRRMALINNQTLMIGETGAVKVHDGHVQVTCKEIHDEYALVVVDGKEVKLPLGGN